MKTFLLFLLNLIALPLTGAPVGNAYQEESTEVDPMEPEVQQPFKTQLKLTEQQLEALAMRAKQRIDEICKESGLENNGSCSAGSWMDKRVKNQCVYDNDLEFRKTMYGGIFRKSNLSRGITKRFAREMSAKVSDDMLGTSPFFAAVKRKSGADAALARAVEEYTQIEVERSNLPSALRQAQQAALIRNEAVVKVRHAEDVTFFVGEATVLSDASGPVVTESGDYIYENDDFVPHPSVEGVVVLKKDPSFEMPEQQQDYFYAYVPELRQRKVERRGIEAHVLDSRSFLCPLTATDIHSADIIVQLLDMQFEDVRAQYGGFEIGQAYCNARTSGEQQAKEIHGEQIDGNQSIVIKTVRVAECYMRVDADGDGIAEEVLLVLDLDTDKPIFYDYRENHFHKRPFEVVVGVESVPNRWYGIGIIQMLWDQNIYVDMQFNRKNMKDTQSGRIRFRDPNAVKEWKAGHAPEFGTSKVFNVEPGYDNQTRPAIWEANLGADAELDSELMGEVIQDMMTTFGVISAKDASSADLNNSRTATGILNMERTANTATRYTEISQKIGIEAVLRQAVVISLENMPEMAAFFSKDGETLMTLNKTEAREIEKDVRLFLTRARSTESLIINQQAAAVINEYFDYYENNPRRLMYSRPNYIARLKALEVGDADETLPVVDEEYLAQWQEQMTATQQAAMDANKPDVNLAYDKAPPSIQAQIEAEKGYRPAPLAERLAAQRAAKAKPAEKSPAKKEAVKV